MSQQKIREFQFRDERFRVTQFPKNLPSDKRFIFVDEIDHHGANVRVTQIERTIVDCLDRINLSGGLEEVWRSLNAIEKANAEKIVEYALLLNNATTVAKLGFFLRLRQQQWQINEQLFTQLKTHLPQTVHYLDRKKRIDGKHIKEWRLIVPNELIGEQWEETLDMDDV